MPADHPSGRPPVLVLGLGNTLMRDDGVGLVLLEHLRRDHAHDERVELLDGGTQGLALLPHLADRRGLLVLDAITRGDVPGTVHVVDKATGLIAGRDDTAHELGARTLLAAASLIGDAPAVVEVVGVEPEDIHTGLGLSATVAAALPKALDVARGALAEIIDQMEICRA